LAGSTPGGHKWMTDNDNFGSGVAVSTWIHIPPFAHTTVGLDRPCLDLSKARRDKVNLFGLADKLMSRNITKVLICLILDWRPMSGDHFGFETITLVTSTTHGQTTRFILSNALDISSATMFSIIINNIS